MLGFVSITVTSSGGGACGCALPLQPLNASKAALNASAYRATSQIRRVLKCGLPILSGFVADLCSQRSAHGLDHRGEDVSGAPLRADELRLRALRLDLAAQAADLHVDRAVVDLVVVQARQLEQLLARQHALRGREEGDQQVELAVR